MKERLRELLDRYLEGRLSEVERKELLGMVREPGSQVLLEQMLGEDFMSDRFVEESKIETRKAKVFKIGRWKWVAAASIVFVVCSLWFVVSRKSGVRGPRSEEMAVHDVKAPDSTKATITLANGKIIIPDIKNGSVEVIKETEYNILNNPRGSKVVDVVLSDGTHVWLNAESSLKYPVVFNGERKVELTGEGYFEVKTPGFKVVANGVEIEDLGTEFNVNSYEQTKTTLIKGKVKIGDVLLKVGEMAVNNNVIGSVDVEEITAWKNGTFYYKGVSIETIMKDVERWYDVDVVFEDKITEKFYADVSRETNVSTLFKVLETTKAVKFKIDGKKITVFR